MKKPVLSIDEPEPKKALRADRPPTEGFVTIVDGHFKSEFDTVEAAEAAGRKLKSAYPMLQIEIYDADKKVRTFVELAKSAIASPEVAARSPGSHTAYFLMVQSGLSRHS
jgi:hypothetical protein